MQIAWDDFDVIHTLERIIWSLGIPSDDTKGFWLRPVKGCI